MSELFIYIIRPCRVSCVICNNILVYGGYVGQTCATYLATVNASSFLGNCLEIYIYDLLILKPISEFILLYR